MLVAKEKINILDVIPYKSEHLTTEQEGNLSVIAFPRFKYEWMNRFLLPKGMSPHIRVRLEEYGTEVWKLIDGHRTVQEIIDLLADYFDNEENYGQRIATYIVQLNKDGFVKYKVKE